MFERKAVALTIPDDAPAGRVQAVFSTFDLLDKQRDIVKKGAFAALDGADVPLVWSHQWDALPLGKGVVRVQPRQAVFDGQFHLMTQHSRDAYETVKAMGALQEYSYGFQVAPDGVEVIEADDGGPARVITKIDRVYEVSPVLVGAGEQTRTLAIKGLTEELSDLKVSERLSRATRQQLRQMRALVDALLTGYEDDAADADQAAAPPDDEKPLPNFHACRLRDPGAFQDGTFRQMTRDHNGKEYRVIMGRLKGEDTMTDQALRYAKDTWTAAAAGAHCRSHDGTFEAARATESALEAQPPAPAERMALLCATLRDFQDWLAAQPLAGDAAEHEWAASVEHRAAALQQVLTDRKARRRLTAYLAPFTPPTPSGAR